MYKSSIEIGSIGGVKIKFNCVMLDDKGKKVIAVGSMDGHEYLTLTPKSYITIDFSKNDTQYVPKHHINLGQYFLFLFIKKLKAVIQSTKIPDMFFYYNDKLQVNGTLQKQHQEYAQNTTSTILMQPGIVYDTSSANGDLYEGILFYNGNVVNNFMLTIQEAEFLEELLLISLNNFAFLSLELINNFILAHPKFIYSNNKVVMREVKETDVTSIPVAQVKKPNELSGI